MSCGPWCAGTSLRARANWPGRTAPKTKEVAQLYFAPSEGARFGFPLPGWLRTMVAGSPMEHNPQPVSAPDGQTHGCTPVTLNEPNVRGTLVLASASPRRQAFLRTLGLPVHLHPTDVDEAPLPAEDPASMTVRLATLKAKTARASLSVERLAPPVLLLGLDTTVAQAGTILGKPNDATEAVHFLRRLRTGPHQVFTGYCLINLRTGRERTGMHGSDLTMRSYTDTEIDAYVRTGDPFDKAGGYALQDPEFNPVARLDGCAASVMGMPMHDLLHLLQDEAGWPIPRNFDAVCVRLTGHACCQTP